MKEPGGRESTRLLPPTVRALLLLLRFRGNGLLLRRSRLLLLHRNARLAVGAARKLRAIGARLRTSGALDRDVAPHGALLGTGLALAVREQAAVRRRVRLNRAGLLERSARPRRGRRLRRTATRAHTDRVRA